MREGLCEGKKSRPGTTRFDKIYMQFDMLVLLRQENWLRPPLNDTNLELPASTATAQGNWSFPATWTHKESCDRTRNYRQY